MKITKRYCHSEPKGTMNLWLIPTLLYMAQKVGGVSFNQYEWIWWIGIPALMITWFLMNFKVIK